MVSYCCVKGCGNNSHNKKKDPSSMISFHAFPCNQELKTKWLKAIGRPNWSPPSHARICSTHFNHDNINYEGCRIRIKDDAVPGINLPANSNFEATNIEACRICLATDIKLYSLQDTQLSSYIESIAGFNANLNIEGLPQYVCYLCAANLRTCYKLVEKSMTAQSTLLDIFARNGQITKSLIKQQNRDKLNLTTSLNYCTTKTNYIYEYNEEHSTTYFNNHHDIIKDIYLKNEREEVDFERDLKSGAHSDVNKYKLTLKEDTLNDEMNNDDFLDDSYEDIPVVEEDIQGIVEEKHSKYEKLKKKRIKCKGGLIGKKSPRKKDKDLTPDETDMQKYFDIVKLSFQEQIEEWKRSTVRRPLTSETVYECEVCSKMFAHVNTYRTHVASHDPSRGKAECPVCKLRFKSDILVKSHTNRAHAKKFYCKTCPKVFNNVGVAKKHHRWHSGYSYKCASCPFSTAHESSLGVHVRRSHAHTHACTYCGRTLASGRGLQLHVATAHRDLKETKITLEYRCESCDINFASEGAKRVHLLTSSQHRKNTDLGYRIYSNDPTTNSLHNTCSKCGEEFLSLKALVTHTKLEHPRPNRKQWRMSGSYPTQCELCGETVSCRKKHWLHFRRQHPKETDTYQPVVTAVCDTCGKGFQNSTKLYLHQLRHSTPTVRCDACPRLFYDKYALARHTITHRTNKPHQCRTCGRAFKLRSNLERHSRVHTDIAPYECTMCCKKFKYSSSVNLHVRTVHYKLPHPPRKKRSKSIRDSICANDV